MKFKLGQRVIVKDDKILPGNDVGPQLVKNQHYEIKAIVKDSKGNQHLDVGLESKYNFIRSFETGEELPNGSKIHWCHPSRFELAE